MLVEALILLEEIGKIKKGDILLIQPIEFPWAPGDLRSRFVAKIDFPNFPCNKKLKERFKCHSCEFKKLEWSDNPPKKGSKSKIETDCFKELYTGQENYYIMEETGNGLLLPTMKVGEKMKGRLNLKYLTKDKFPEHCNVFDKYTKKSKLTKDDAEQYQNFLKKTKEHFSVGHLVYN